MVKQALQHIANEVPEARVPVVALLRKMAASEYGEQVIAGDLNEMFGGRKYDPGPGKQKPYGPPYSSSVEEGKWKPRQKGKCFYETGDEADRCYTTINGGLGGQTKPDTGKAKNRSEYNKKYRKQRWDMKSAVAKQASFERLAKLRAQRTAAREAMYFSIPILGVAPHDLDRHIRAAQHLLGSDFKVSASSTIGDIAVVVITTTMMSEDEFAVVLSPSVNDLVQTVLRVGGKLATGLFRSMNKAFAQAVKREQGSSRLAELRAQRTAADKKTKGGKKWIIMKAPRARANLDVTPQNAYGSKTTCEKAGVKPSQVYTDEKKAKADAKKLGDVNPVGFTVVRLASAKQASSDRLAKLRVQRTAASPMDLSDVPQDVLKAMAKLKATPAQAFNGIHGKIVIGRTNRDRFGPQDLKALLGISGFRWVTFSGSKVHIGF